MKEPQCPYLTETDSANHKKPMQLKVMVELDGQNLPVFGEKREFDQGRNVDDATKLTICGMCTAIEERVAIKRHRYENFCMQSGYPDCGRFITGEKK